MGYETINLPTLAERLIAARKAAKVTQEAAADHLGMSRPTFIAIEKGTRRPKPQELIRLAEFYSEPLNRLLRDEKRPSTAYPHLRSLLEASAEGQVEVEAATTRLLNFVDDYQYLESLTGETSSRSFPPPVRIPHGSLERFAEFVAQEERERLNLGVHQPTLMLRSVLEEAGLHVFFDKLHSNLAGLYLFVPDFGYCILVNSVHPRERRRWTVAHEYAHFLVDRDNPGIDYMKRAQRRPDNERFADLFAAAFLMPDVGVKRRFYEGLGRTGDFKVSDLCRMADFYAVSFIAMTLRLESLGLIPRGSWDAISATRISLDTLQQKVGVGSAQALDSSDFYPRRYKLLAVEAYNKDLLSEGELARVLRCPRIRAREIVADCSAAPNDTDGIPSQVPLELGQSLLATAISS